MAIALHRSIRKQNLRGYTRPSASIQAEGQTPSVSQPRVCFKLDLGGETAAPFAQSAGHYSLVSLGFLLSRNLIAVREKFEIRIYLVAASSSYLTI